MMVGNDGAIIAFYNFSPTQSSFLTFTDVQTNIC